MEIPCFKAFYEYFKQAVAFILNYCHECVLAAACFFTSCTFLITLNLDFLKQVLL